MYKKINWWILFFHYFTEWHPKGIDLKLLVSPDWNNSFKIFADNLNKYKNWIVNDNNKSNNNNSNIELVDGYLLPQHILYDDVTKGTSRVPIRCVNQIDDEKFPTNIKVIIIICSFNSFFFTPQHRCHSPQRGIWMNFTHLHSLFLNAFMPMKQRK